jgi:hypothetical protein
MSRRENQALQVAVIIFAVLSFLLATTTVVFYRNYDESQRKAEAALSQAESARRAAESLDIDSTALRGVIGHPRDAALVTIQQIQQEDSRTIRPALADSVVLTYRQLVDVLESTLGDAIERELSSKDREAQLLSRLQTLAGEQQAIVDQYRQTADRHGVEMAGARAEFVADRASLFSQSDELARLLEGRGAEMVELNTRFRQMQRELNRRIEQLEIRYAKAVQKIRGFESGDFDVADGQIVRVDAGVGFAYVNLGSDDRLPSQISFSVFSGDVDGGSRDRPKGRIEITKILGPHSSEARVIDEEHSDMILPGDVIYTPVWHRSKPRRFALAGPLDIDGDGSSDRQRVLSIISTAGGVVDEELRPDGTRQGAMTLDTRYLVLGARPTARDASREYLDAYSELIRRAEDLHVQVLSLDKFVELVGYSSPNRVIRLGPGTDQTTQPSDSFRRIPAKRAVLRY